MISKWYNKNMATDPQIPGKRPIVTDEVELAEPWKVKPLGAGFVRSGAFTGAGRGASGGGGNTGGDGDDDPKGKRPSLTDITLIGFEPYEDVSGLTRYKAKFRVYNSSGESIDKFDVALTLSDTQGGRS